LKKIIAVCLFVVTFLALMPLLITIAQDEPVEITFTHIFDDDRQLVIQAIADAFMAQHPNVTITLRANADGYDTIFNNALLAAEQGDAPNILQVEEGFTQLAVDSGYFVAVSDVATEEQLTTLDDILPSIKNFYSIGDTVWSLPWNSSNPVFYYNKTMFEEAGLDPDTPPHTFQDVLTACETLMNSELDLAGCINFPMVTWFAEQWVAMQNGLIVNNNNGRDARATETLFDNPEMLNVLSWWNELADRGYYFYSGTPNDYNGEGIAFLSQQSAMTINSTAGLTLMMNFSTAQNFELGVAPLPLPDETATNGVTVGGASVWLLADQSPEELQAANDFIFFLTNTDNDILWHQGTGYVPNRFSSIESLTSAGWFDENPFFSIAVNQLAESQNNPATAGYVVGPSAEVRGYLIDAFQSVIDGGADPIEALQVAKERADAELQDYNAFFE
jgi:sn-glycerol 3-phosphate transport system substrate-binding protein